MAMCFLQKFAIRNKDPDYDQKSAMIMPNAIKVMHDNHVFPQSAEFWEGFRDIAIDRKDAIFSHVASAPRLAV